VTIGASAEGAIVVTGGLGGIGQAVVQAILEDTEYRCAVLDLAESGPHRDADRVLTVGCDVTASDQVAAAIAAVDEWGGPIVGLVNSAGVAHHIPTLELDLAEWRRVLAIHLDGTFLVSQQVGRKMVSGNGGAIVNLGSVAMFFGWPGRLAYSASKGAIGAMTRTLAVEWADHNIRVNCIAPGYVDTPLVADLVEREIIDGDRFRNLHAARRFGTPREIASVIVFLLSDAAAYMTGEVVRVDGGFSAVKLPREP
jgi:NAD(P)-dependent dehydrogenase (short-subunit alcohol dehydrogenase family)